MKQDFFQTEAEQKVKDLRESLRKHGRHASGKTAAAIRGEATDEGYEIYGPRHIYTLVYGRKPTGSGGGNGSLLDNIKAWIAEKHLDLNPYAVTAKIHREGTKLYIDIKAGGSPSKVIEDVFGAGYTDKLKERLQEQFLQEAHSELAEFTEIKK